MKRTTQDRFPPKTITRDDYLSGGQDLDFRLGIYRFVQAARRLGDCREAFGRWIDLTSSQYLVLMGIAYAQGTSGITIASIATHVGLAATHVTTEVGRLIRRGLLVKAPSAEDRRSVLVSLTPAGELAVRDVIVLVRQINDILFKNISRREFDALVVTSEKLIRNSEYAMTELRLLESDRADGETH